MYTTNAAVEIFSYLETLNKLFSSGKQTILKELMYFFKKDHTFHTLSPLCCLSQVDLTQKDALYT